MVQKMKQKVEITNHLRKGGEVSGVWRECEAVRTARGDVLIRILTVWRIGDEPIETKVSLSALAFDLMTDVMVEMSNDLKWYSR